MSKDALYDVIDKIKELAISADVDISKVVRIQKTFRGYLYRRARMSIIMYVIKTFLEKKGFQFSRQNEDGRINSCFDEEAVIKLLINKFGSRIYKHKMRMWYDILVRDIIYGWIPINIKTTSTLSSDNSGNLTMCVYSYTAEILDIHHKNSYDNGKMSDILFTNLKNKKYNMNTKKDYYFIVMNKTDPTDIIINSIKGLSILTPNINNLPFQICWDKNRTYTYENISVRVKQFVTCLQKSKPSWKETFMTNIRTL